MNGEVVSQQKLRGKNGESHQNKSSKTQKKMSSEFSLGSEGASLQGELGFISMSQEEQLNLSKRLFPHNQYSRTLLLV